MNEMIIKDEKNIENMIYEFRGKQVILDSDLAILYQCKNGTKEINQAVKNNPKKFPERFSWILTDEESDFLVKSFDQKKETRGGKYKNPRVFTEQGVSMLSTVLKTKVATEVSIAIMDAFVAMRHYIVENRELYMNAVNVNNKLDNHEVKLLEHDKQIKQLFNKFDKKEKTESIYFNGELYDAYSKIVDIISIAKKELIIIDGYADKTVLDMIRNIGVNVILICKENMKLKPLDIEKYKEQYNNLSVIYDDSWHDRYIVIDEKVIYHCGASINHAGSRTFSINRLEDKEVIEAILKKITFIKR